MEKEDFLEVDARIPGQNYVCLSVVNPEKFMKQKEVFFATKYLHHIFNDQEQISRDFRERMNENRNISYNTIKESYDDWKYTREQELEDEFHKSCDYQTTMRAIKIRGTYDTLREAKKKAELLQRRDPSFHVFVGQVGYWLPLLANVHQIEDQEYVNKELNTLMENYKQNIEQKDILYQQMKEERIQEARKEVARKKREHAEKLKEEQEREPAKMEDTTGEIGKLRNLLNTVDENLIETEKKRFENNQQSVEETNQVEINEVQEGGASKEEPVEQSLEEQIQGEYSEAQQQNEESLNNFTADNMANLEQMDPWLRRKMEQEGGASKDEQ